MRSSWRGRCLSGSGRGEDCAIHITNEHALAFARGLKCGYGTLDDHGSALNAERKLITCIMHFARGQADAAEIVTGIKRFARARQAVDAVKHKRACFILSGARSLRYILLRDELAGGQWRGDLIARA